MEVEEGIGGQMGMKKKYNKNKLLTNKKECIHKLLNSVIKKKSMSAKLYKIRSKKTELQRRQIKTIREYYMQLIGNLFENQEWGWQTSYDSTPRKNPKILV